MTITAREMYLMEAAFEMGKNSECNGGWGFDLSDAEVIEYDMPESLKVATASKILEEIHRESVLLSNATYTYPPEAQRVAGKILKHLWLRLADVLRGPSDEDEDADDDGIESATHVERVSLRGNGVTRSEILNNLLEKDDYFITKIAWGAREIAGSGHDYDIEAMFANPRDCIEFSFILRGVYPFEDGQLCSRRRTPFKHEIEVISGVVEAKARQLVRELTEEFNKAAIGGADAD